MYQTEVEFEHLACEYEKEILVKVHAIVQFTTDGHETTKITIRHDLNDVTEIIETLAPPTYDDIKDIVDDKANDNIQSILKDLE